VQSASVELQSPAEILQWETDDLRSPAVGPNFPIELRRCVRVESVSDRCSNETSADRHDNPVIFSGCKGRSVEALVYIVQGFDRATRSNFPPRMGGAWFRR